MRRPEARPSPNRRTTCSPRAWPTASTRGGFVRALVGLAIAATTGLGSAGASAAPFAYITNQGSHDVSVIDLALQRVVATVPVGRSPAGVVAVGAIGKVFVSNPDSKSISVLDMRSQAVVGTLAAGAGPVGIDASADGRALIVSDWFRNRVLIFDTRRLDASAREVAVGTAPAGVAVASDARLAYVAERDDDSVAAIDVVAASVLWRVKVGSHPFALLLDEPRQRLFALNVQSDDVSVVDLRSRRVAATVKVGRAPYGAVLADAARLLYVTNQHGNTVSVVDAETLAPLRTLDGFAYPEGIAAHADKVYVVNWMDDCVSVLDARSGRELDRIGTGTNSRGFGAFIGEPSAH